MGLVRTCRAAASACVLGSNRVTGFERQASACVSKLWWPWVCREKVPGQNGTDARGFPGSKNAITRGRMATVIHKSTLPIHAPWLVAILLLMMSVMALAQQQPSRTTASPIAKNSASGSLGKPAQASPPISSGQAVYLVRSTLMMLNDANRSGNYSVLRDLAAPDFQARNSAADLAQNFADLRRRHFDLFAAALLEPHFTVVPALDANGRLQLTGFFPTSPSRIDFDLIFQSVSGEWRLLAVSVATPPTPATQSQINHNIPPHSSAFLYGFRIFSGTVGWRW